MKWGRPETSNMEGASGVAEGEGEDEGKRRGRAGEEGGARVRCGNPVVGEGRRRREGSWGG